jgi:putative ABC transport system ATP-binding protein
MLAVANEPNVPAVHCAGITKTYGGGSNSVRALRGVDLDVNPGELLMLVGPSGCGKTTLISIIAGILDYDDGHCTLYGDDIAHLKKKERALYRGKNVGFVFQAFNLVPALSAAENVAVPLLINGIKTDEALTRAANSLSVVDLQGREASFPAQLSGGQQQRVAIARALVHNPRIVVCDEPTSALDHDTGTQVMQVLRGLTGERALIIVTHDARIFEYADRIAYMDDGRIVKIQ